MSSSPTRDAVMAALSKVNDPELHKDLVTLGMVKQCDVGARGEVALNIELTTPACPMKGQISRDVEEAVGRVPGVTGVKIDFSARVTSGKSGGASKPGDLTPGVKNIIGVASGKGGVGKSTVALNLAISLGKTGAKVGLLDADIYGPNIPNMMAIPSGQPPIVIGEKMQPIEKYGIKMISMGLLVPEDQPIVWRGPMLNSALRQLFGDVNWGELDYLIIDLPPGTGDVQISLVQLVQVTGCVIVSTPQTVSLLDARKGMAMFHQTNTPVLGLIENMSYFICDQCEKRHDIFDTGGVARIAKAMELPFLGALPLVGAVREGGDDGAPITVVNAASEVSRKFMEIAQNLAAQVSVMNAKSGAEGGLEIKLGA